MGIAAFMDEMRSYAMKLHTRDQAKEGGKEAAKTPFQAVGNC